MKSIFIRWCMRVIVSTFFLTLTTLAFGLDQQQALLKKQTEALVELSHAMASGKKLAEEELRAAEKLARSRHEAILKAIHEDPANIVQFLLPKTITSLLPSELQPYLENEQNNLEGKLEISGMASDKINREVIHYKLIQNDGTHLYLHFPGRAPDNLKTDQKLRIQHGMRILTTDGTSILFVSPEEISVLQDVTTLGIVGTRKVIAILVNFQNNPTNRPWTVDQVRNNIFNNVNSVYREFSFGQLTLAGNVVGWFTIPMNSNTSCNDVWNILPGLAENAATRAGVDLSQYQHRMYVFPRNNNCWWSGWGVFGGSFTRAWLNGSIDSGLIAHEVGHNLTLYHSHSLKCPNSPNTGNCTRVEYGDYADNMGSGGYAHWNAYQKNRLGWFSTTTSPRIFTVTTSGSYRIDPYETSSNIKALRVLKRINSDGSREYYYVEKRFNIGYDRGIATCTNCDFTKGVLIHQGNERFGNTCDILDMTPSDNNARYAALLPGRSWRDPYAANGGVRFTLTSIDPTTGSALINITFGPSTTICKEKAPAMQILPSQTQWVKANEEAKYTLKLTNNSTDNCQPAQFSLSTKSDQNVTTSLSEKTLKVAPGKSTVVNLLVKASAGTIGSMYTVDVTGINAAKPNENTNVKLHLGLQ